MTFSILAKDAETGRMIAGAATGSLCVGGWVLRGNILSGLSASQGTSPSTLWGEEVLEKMRAGMDAQSAVNDVVNKDPGRDHRQLAAISPAGDTAAFTGAESIEAASSTDAENIVAAGNMLTTEKVLDAAITTYQTAPGTLPERMLAALDAAESAGSDSRGLLSAALLMVGKDMPPLSLRIDYSVTPLKDLRALFERATSGAYGEWLDLVPTVNTPGRYPTFQDFARLATPADPNSTAASPFVET